MSRQTAIEFLEKLYSNQEILAKVHQAYTNAVIGVAREHGYEINPESLTQAAFEVQKTNPNSFAGSSNQKQAQINLADEQKTLNENDLGKNISEVSSAIFLERNQNTQSTQEV